MELHMSNHKLTQNAQFGCCRLLTQSDNFNDQVTGMLSCQLEEPSVEKHHLHNNYSGKQ